MRTTKKERQANAKQFYNAFMNSNCDEIAIIVNRAESTNPNINRCQFIAVPSMLSYGKPVVIAESVMGIEGCFIELLGFIKDCIQKKYFEDGFNEWLQKIYGFRISYKDGLVFMLKK